MNQTDLLVDRPVPFDPLRPWISLLVLQPSPFCNIDCDYCYLPNRISKKRMPLEIVAATIEKVFGAELVWGPLTVIWHAGEPLAVPISYYEQAFEEIRRKTPAGALVRHCMQSNGMLINDAWCQFISAHHVSIGLSIDGPADLHDEHRKTRSEKGSHQAAMAGVRRLQAHGIPFRVISVITQQSLGQAKDIYQFFYELGISQLGFNIEEIEGENRKSSLTSSESIGESVEGFMATIFELQKADGGRPKVSWLLGLSKIGVSHRSFAAANRVLDIQRRTETARRIFGLLGNEIKLADTHVSLPCDVGCHRGHTP